MHLSNRLLSVSSCTHGQALKAASAADGGEALAAIDPAAAKLLEGAAELAYNAGLAGGKAPAAHVAGLLLYH